MVANEEPVMTLTNVLLVVCAAIPILLSYWFRRNRLRASGINYNHQTKEIHQYVRKADGKPGNLGWSCPNTLYGMMERGNGPCLGYRPSVSSPYSWITYNQASVRSQNFGAGLLYLGLQPRGKNFLGILAPTRPEWVIAEYGCYTYSIVIAPLYDSLGADACQMAMNTLSVEVMLCGSEKNYRTLMSSSIKSTNLVTFIFMDNISDQLRQDIKNTGGAAYTFQEVEDLGQKNPQRKQPPQPEDLAMLMFTSGTTGAPKAAELTHESISSSVEDFLHHVLPLRMDHTLRAFGYLPLAHIFERMMEVSTFVHGGQLGFNSSGIMGMYDDLQELRPTAFAAVPRVLSKLHTKMWSASRNSLALKIMLPVALWFKTQEMKLGIFRNNSIWDKLVFHHISDLLGGSVKLCAVGSAPIDGKTLHNMRAALGCYIFEGYGQTESGGLLTLTLPGDLETGHVGIPSKDVEIKLVDVPELQYYAKDGKGEICAKTKRTFRAYYKQEGKTKETIDEEGWLHTGDVGQWLPSGRLRIIDRKKHIFKLSQGEYIAPEKIENGLLGASPYLEQIFVDGSSVHPFTVGLIYPNYRTVAQDLHRSVEEIKKNPTLCKELILADLVKTGKANKLNSFEIPKNCLILKEQFSLENGYMTPTQKVKREEVRKGFKGELEKLYLDTPDANK
ncbi:long-chain-fatty-acid--CoA ligase 5-like isoform X2 [Paramacrobiotus metropolitanus]|uniref:long-chain-fatty-acid--CoA ligase 5-like isoform X2 n=1 Tax=Paramacrobiotus metropolitanus TaxID=2943436 RepID=UPI0024461230|nr:long-chain-fatty-acid--CoA ligase 5-like isoform X2 [Paramacrobiotus metropolitanus]